MEHYASNKGYLILSTVIAFTILLYWIWYPFKMEIGKGIYSTATLFRWIPYFAFMLVGAIVGKNYSKSFTSGIFDVCMLLLSVILFYGIQQLGVFYLFLNSWQIVTIFPLMGIIFYLYRICNMPVVLRIYNIPAVQKVILVVGGICLESYLIQFSLLTDRFTSILFFPCNLIFNVLIIIAVAYLCRCFARFFSQTFSNQQYNWFEIVKPY